MADTPADATQVRAALGLAALALCALVSTPYAVESPALDALSRVLARRVLSGGSSGGMAFGAAELVTIAAGGAFVLALLVWGAVLARKRRRDEGAVAEERKGRNRLVGLVVLALLVVAVRFGWRGAATALEGAIGSDSRSGTEAGPPPSASFSPPTEAVSERLARDGDREKIALALLGAAGLVAAALALASRRAARGTGLRSPEEDAPFAPRRVEAAARVLATGDSARDAILACYAALCRAFDDGSGSERALTAREFATLLERRGVGRTEVSALTAVFEKARYSDESCGVADRDRAAAALGAILDSKRGGDRD